MQKIKEIIKQSLEKQGYTLSDLEDALGAINTADGIRKYATIVKEAGFLEDLLKATGAGVETAFTGSIAGGAALGGLGLLAQRTLEKEDNGFNARKGETQRLQTLMERLHKEHGVAPRYE